MGNKRINIKVVVRNLLVITLIIILIVALGSKKDNNLKLIKITTIGNRRKRC